MKIKNTEPRIYLLGVPLSIVRTWHTDREIEIFERSETHDKPPYFVRWWPLLPHIFYVGGYEEGCDQTAICAAVEDSDLVFVWGGSQSLINVTDPIIAELLHAWVLRKTVHIACPSFIESQWSLHSFCNSGHLDFAHNNPLAALNWYLGLRDLKTMPYREYLKTDHWQTTRLQALERARRRCQVCNSPNQLDVHHRTYEHRGAEQPEDLTVLCRKCHEVFHQNRQLEKAAF